jgi:Domain of unknown function (DUF4272)
MTSEAFHCGEDDNEGGLDDRDELERFPPPTPVMVARKALILSAVVCRSHLESYKDEEYRRQTAEFIHEWFDELDLWPHLEPDEERIIRAGFGQMHPHDRARGTWYVEGLAILAWALNRGAFPPHDQKVDPIAVTDGLGFLDPDAGKLLNAPSLRDREDLMAAREWFYGVHCTLRIFLRGDGASREAEWITSYTDRIGLAQNEILEDGWLLFRGSRFEVAPRDQLEDWESVVCERHRATMWLEGSDEPYTEISVDT